MGFAWILYTNIFVATDAGLTKLTKLSITSDCSIAVVLSQALLNVMSRLRDLYVENLEDYGMYKVCFNSSWSLRFARLQSPSPTS